MEYETLDETMFSLGAKYYWIQFMIDRFDTANEPTAEHLLTIRKEAIPGIDLEVALDSFKAGWMSAWDESACQDPTAIDQNGNCNYCGNSDCNGRS